MILRTALAALAVQVSVLLFPGLTSGDDPIDPGLIKLTILEPRGPMRVDFQEKVKVKIELKQPAHVRRPDFVFLVLAESNGDRMYSDWATAKSQDDKNIYQDELKIPGIKNLSQ